MKELINDLRLGASICRTRETNLDYAVIADKAAAALERLTTERDAAKEKIDTLWIQSADRAAKIDSLTAERDAMKEGLDGWHARCLDMEVERDALKEQMTADRKQFLDMRDERDELAQDAERVRVYKQRYFEAIAERDALAGEKHA